MAEHFHGRTVPAPPALLRTDELGWAPTHDAIAALRELLLAMARAQGTASPVLRPGDPFRERLRASLKGHPPGHGDCY